LSAATSVAAGAATATAPGVIVVGPLPPPYHGGAVATRYVLDSDVARRCRIIHVDTTDPRGLENIGRFDAGNVALALRHALAMLAALATQRPAAAYVPVAQNRLGLLRDAALILPALLLRRRLVVHLHGSGIRELHDSTDPLTRALLRYVLSRADRVIVLGESLRPLLEGITAAERIAVLPNGVADAFGGMPARRRDATPLRVLYLGNVRAAKGYHIAVEAVTILERRGFDVELHVAGGYSSPQDRADAARAFGALRRPAVLHGPVDAATRRALLQSADAFVMPSFTEGHPYVLLEAMSAGLPIVASALPTVAETLVDGESGLHVPPGDVAACAAALERIACDADFRLRLGCAARRRFEERYSYQVWSRGLARIIEAALP
jgi:glycosyltransferase involved in cell wall biosynthesis